MLPGMVSPNILGIPAFNPTPMTTIKKGINVQKSGDISGLTFGTITKELMVRSVSLCTKTPDAETTEHCGAQDALTMNMFEIKGKGGTKFGKPGDSGALVLTTGTCPQPIGMLESANKNTGRTSAMAIVQVLQTLNFVSGDSTYSIVPGGSCAPSTMGEVTDTTTGNTTLEDLAVPDPDVAQALAVLPYVGFGYLCSGNIAGVGIDLSGSKATLDVVVNTSADLDPYHICIPSNFEGVPVEQEVLSEETGLQIETSRRRNCTTRVGLILVDRIGCGSRPFQPVSDRGRL